MTTFIETPHSPRPARKSSRFNLEKWGWIYMRASGVVLVVLIFMGIGVKALDFAFVGGKLSQPFWQIWDVLLLWLALIHGANGMRTIVNDYAHNRLLGVVFKGALIAATVVLLILGTLVIFTFDPCPTGAALADLPSFCPAP
jgi:succinate dehydrogenase / fumarate reductase membrane anchor subunit